MGAGRDPDDDLDAGEDSDEGPGLVELLDEDMVVDDSSKAFLWMMENMSPSYSKGRYRS